MTYNILIPDQVHEAALNILRKGGDFEVNAPGTLSKPEVLAAIGSAHAVIIRSGVTIDAEVLAAAPNLKLIVRAGVGVDNVNLAEATRRGVVVMNTPLGSTITAAEYAFALLMALARNIAGGHASLGAGKWDRKSLMGIELREKTLGIVGFGRIGQAVAQRARAFEMSVLAYDPYNPHIMRLASEMGCDLVDLDNLYARSDFVTLHPWLSEETRGMINREALAKMKKGARIINIARGALIVDADLAEAIRSGHIAGAALDVYEPEPPAPDNPLLNLPGVLHTPHLAASTEEAQNAVGVEAAHIVVAALKDGDYQNIVNAEVLQKSS